MNIGNYLRWFDVGYFYCQVLSYKSRLFKFSLDTVKLVFVQISGTNF